MLESQTKLVPQVRVLPLDASLGGATVFMCRPEGTQAINKFVPSAEVLGYLVSSRFARLVPCRCQAISVF